MALDYTVYYKGSKDELNNLLNSFRKQEVMDRDLFTLGSIKELDDIKRDILKDMNYQESYDFSIFFRLNKWKAVEATNVLKIFRDQYLTKEKSIFLLNGDTELSN